MLVPLGIMNVFEELVTDPKEDPKILQTSQCGDPQNHIIHSPSHGDIWWYKYGWYMDDIWWCITIFMGDICWYKASSVMGPMGRTIGFITLKNSGTPPFPGPCFAQMSCKSFLSFAHFCKSIKQSKQDWISVCISIHLSIVYIFLGDRHLASPFRFVNMCLAGLPSIEVQAHVAGGFQGCLEAGWTGTPCNHQKQEWNLSPTCNFELWLMICNLIWSQTWWFMIGSETNF
jgi:hypothetical protein